MAMFYEFLPLVLFLIALFVKDIYFAVGVLMVAMPIGFAVKYLRTKKVDRMYFWSTILALVLGGLTLYLRDERFFFWKPTVFYWAVACACLISQFVGAKPLVQRFFGMIGELNTDRITARQWRGLNLTWVVFFAAIGVLNLYVAFNFSIEFWGTFKVLGLFGLSLVFFVGQSIWVVARLGDDAATTSEEEPR